MICTETFPVRRFLSNVQELFRDVTSTGCTNDGSHDVKVIDTQLRAGTVDQPTRTCEQHAKGVNQDRCDVEECDRHVDERDRTIDESMQRTEQRGGSVDEC